MPGSDSLSAGKLKLKKALHELCRESVQKQLSNLRIALKTAQESGNDETKSTTGDKHETGRAMMQMEQEKIGHQLKELEMVADKLERIQLELHSDRILPGNIVLTNRGNFYIAVAGGKLSHEGKDYFAISPASPLGSLLIKSEVGKSVRMNGNEYSILETF